MKFCRTTLCLANLVSDTRRRIQSIGPRGERSHVLRVQDVISLARTPLVDLVNRTLTQEVDDELLSLQAQLQSSSISEADHDTAKDQLELYLEGMRSNIERRGQCPALAAYNYGGYNSALGGAVIPADTFYAASIGSGAAIIDVSLTPPAGTTLLYNMLLPGGGPACDATCVCTKLEDVAGAAKSARFETMQNRLIARLDRNTGRLGAQKTRKLEMIKDVVENELELYDFIIDLSTGLMPLEDPEHAKLDDVISIYVNGPDSYGESAQPNIADSNLKRTTIMELDIAVSENHIGELTARCQVWQPASSGCDAVPLPFVLRFQAMLRSCQCKHPTGVSVLRIFANVTALTAALRVGCPKYGQKCLRVGGRNVF